MKISFAMAYMKKGKSTHLFFYMHFEMMNDKKYEGKKQKQKLHQENQ